MVRRGPATPRRSAPVARCHSMDLAQLGHEVLLGMESAGGVDDHHIVAPGPGRFDGIERDGGRVAPLLPRDDLRRQVRAPHVSNWAPAAARKVSPAARTTSWPSLWRRAASLAIVVVLPVPLTPTTRITAGSPSRCSSRFLSPSSPSQLGGEGLSRLFRCLGAAALTPATTEVVDSRPTSAPRSASSSSCQV